MIAGGAMQVFEIPFWIIIICAHIMLLGTTCGGWRIIATMGMKLTRFTGWQGFAAQFSASFTIIVASRFGIPLSTTHTITTAVVGASALRRTADIRWGVLRRVVLVWVVTFPVYAALAYVAALVANTRFG